MKSTIIPFLSIDMYSNQLIEHLFQWDTQQAVTEIDRIYQDQGFAIVSYVYGAVIVRNKWLKLRSYDTRKRESWLDSDQSNNKNNDPSKVQNDGKLMMTSWQQALFGSSMILPDGAALRTWRRVAYRLGRVVWVSDLSNLNGTDFFPELLEYYLAQWPINLVCFGTYGGNLPTKSWDVIVPAGEWLEENYGITWTYWQDVDYHDTNTQRDWDAMNAACDPNLPTIMMVCLWVPRQEIWSYENRELLKKYGVIACNQWATIDYRAWREKRAPRLVRKLRLESAWRLISDPRKNRSKFWVSWKMVIEIMKLFGWR